jgi:hypothetical protein
MDFLKPLAKDLPQTMVTVSQFPINANIKNGFGNDKKKWTDGNAGCAASEANRDS